MKAVQPKILVAADGASNWLFRYGIEPDVVIGDMDGIEPWLAQKIGPKKMLERVDQNLTDLEKALNWIAEQGVGQVSVFGLGGKRVDHLFSNFVLLWKYLPHFTLSAHHDDWTAFFLQDEKKEFTVGLGQTISLIPFENCSGVTLQGLRYPLKEGQIGFERTGVSNVAESKQITVEVRKGKLAVFAMNV